MHELVNRWLETTGAMTSGIGHERYRNIHTAGPHRLDEEAYR